MYTKVPNSLIGIISGLMILSVVVIDQFSGVTHALKKKRGWLACSTLVFLVEGLQLSAPMAYGALGAVYSETGGVVNIAVEGMMLTGTFFFVWGATLFKSWIAGLLFAIVGAVLISLIHGLATITFKVDHVVSGTALNIWHQDLQDSLACKSSAWKPRVLSILIHHPHFCE